jgi:hypothetical protein
MMAIRAARPIVIEGKMKWKLTVSANWSRDS